MSGIFATALAAVLSLALLGSAAAAAFAPSGTTTTADRGDTRLEEVLNGLVNDGILSAELRDTILTKVAEAGHAEEDEDTEKDEDGDEDEDGENKRDPDPKLRFDVHRLIGGWQKVVMEYLGLERKELMERLRGGETLAAVADTLAGKSAAGLSEALKTPAFAKVDALVKAGKLTEEQGKTAKERVTLAIQELLAREFPAKPHAERTPKPEQENSGQKAQRENAGQKIEREKAGKKVERASSGKNLARSNPGRRP